MHPRTILALTALLLSNFATAQDRPNPYLSWRKAGAITILTTPEGAGLPAMTSVENFPLLVRLDRDWFDFGDAKPGGEDIRFSTSNGDALAYEIDEWNAARGRASIWVRVPRIVGNTRQTLRIFWGKADAKSESDGHAVFNESNGYLSVWHLGEAVRDEVGTLESKDVGTTRSAGIVGNARHLAGKQGIFGGEKITTYPAADAPHTTEVWFRAEKPNVTILGWGNEGGGRGSKVRMQLRSPPHVHVDSDFSDIKGSSRVPIGEWVSVAHTFGDGPRKLFINGALDGEASTRLDIKTPARLWLGGWYHNYDFVGDLDEVRVSKVARSADWIRMQFENQKPLQTLVGPIIQPGNAFAITPAEATLDEGTSVTFRADAGGAQKMKWSLMRDGVETILAVDRFAFKFDAGRVSGDSSATLRFSAVFQNEVKTRDIPIAIKEAMPDPVFTLNAPAAWDGRSTIKVIAQGVGAANTEWRVEPFAVIKETLPGKLILKRAQNSGTLTVHAIASNGGKPVSQTAQIAVTEPQHDAWVSRTPGPDEKPEDGQFFARDDSGKGTLVYNGTLAEPADAVFLKVLASDPALTGDSLFKSETQKPGADLSYKFTIPLNAGLVRYWVQFGTVQDGREKILHTVRDLVCGDAFLLNGQSNAVATDWGKDEPPTFHSEWIRTFGIMSGNQKGERIWGEATYRARDGRLQIGYWAMELARQLVEAHKMPICIINGAVGGTRIDQHQRNAADPDDMATIYGRLLWRVREARLTHGIRAVLWHQGENDQGADGPSGGFGWETYRDLFIELAGAWKQDFPNIQRYYVFQIWPKSCAMGIDGSDNRLREVQRTLPGAFSNMSIMSTLGIEPPGGCHFPPAGYSEIARLIRPLIERDFYGVKSPAPITPPNLQHARFTTASNDEIALTFDQPVKWDASLASQFYLDGEKGRIESGTVAGNVLTLKLSAPSSAKTITYLDSKEWSQKTLLRGENGIAALTFCEVPLR